MWTRSLLKQNAKQALQGRYWRCFVVCLVISLLGGAIANINARLDQAQELFSGHYGSNIPTDEAQWERYFNSLPSNVWVLVGLLVMIGGLLGFCWYIFLLSPLQVGQCRYFMENRQAPTPYNTVTGIFRTPYGNVVAVMLLTTLKILVGYLVIIPGIYWSYCYALVPYLLAENPYMSTQRAMELSKDMMYGEKWNFFVLQLSFIGWHILSMITIIGFLFLNPYLQATYAEFYAAMRAKAFNSGLCAPQELGGFVTHESL